MQQHGARLRELVMQTHSDLELADLSRQRGGAPTPHEAVLAAEAYDNLAAVTLGFSPAELAAPAAALPGTHSPEAPGGGSTQKPAFSARAAARSLGLLPEPPPQVAATQTSTGVAARPTAVAGLAAAVATATQPYTPAAALRSRLGDAAIGNLLPLPQTAPGTLQHQPSLPQSSGSSGAMQVPQYPKPLGFVFIVFKGLFS